jgi:membrane protease YdiL (CAAX protease family)
MPGTDQERPRSVPAARRVGTGWTLLAAVEVVLTVTAVLGLVAPTIPLLVLVGVSLAIRREHLTTIGLTRPARPGRMALEVLGWVIGWTVVLLGLVMPVLNRLTGDEQDLTDLLDVEGDLGLLLVFLVLTWTVAAIGEEVVYRGFLPTRITDVTGRGAAGVLVAVLGSSVLFGLAHTEQGTIGVAVTFLDALLFTWLRLRYATLWASVLAHGFNNTIGLVALYLVGPIYGFW